MKKELKPECAEHAMWHRRFTVAIWLLLAMSFGLIFFANAPPQTLFFIGGSMVFWFLRENNDIDHAKWHLDNDNEGSDYEYKP